MTVATPRRVHVPVMMPPMGKIKILVPGRMKTVEVALAAEAVPVAVSETASSERAPTRKEAWFKGRVSLMAAPVAGVADRLTIGDART